MTRKEINKKGKLLIIKIQQNSHKSISTSSARDFCGEENFVEIIKHLKYEGFLEKNSQGYQLTAKGYKFNPTKALLRKYWGYLVLFAAFMVGLVTFLNGGLDLFTKTKQLNKEENKSINETELVLNTNSLIFELNDLSLKEFKKDTIFIKSVGPGNIILDSLLLSNVKFTDKDYLLRDDRIDLEPRVELITYHFKEKALTKTMNSDIISMDLKFDMIPNVQPNDWFENNKMNIVTITYKVFYSIEGKSLFKEVNNNIILELKEL